MVLLGIRAVVKEDLQTSPFEHVYGSSPRLPGQLVSPAPWKASESVNNLIDGIRSFLHHHPPIAPRPQTVTTYVHPKLRTSSHVYVRHDAIQRPLSPPYDGPYKVLKRTEKTFTIDRDGKEDVVSIDRLKPAYMQNQLDKHLTVSPQAQYNLLVTHTPPTVQTPTPILRHPEDNTLQPKTVTKSGRRVHFPKWLRDYT